MIGSLEIVCGPMFSGKTSELIQKTHQYLDIYEVKKDPKRAIIISSKKDNRNINKYKILTSHGSVKREIRDCITCKSVEKLKEIDISIYDFVAVDESQFFDDLEESVNEWLKLGKNILCVGLISDINKNKFGSLLDLFPKACEIKHLKAYCVLCKDHIQNGVFTKLSKETGSKEVVFVSGVEHYIPVCNKHY